LNDQVLHADIAFEDGIPGLIAVAKPLNVLYSDLPDPYTARATSSAINDAIMKLQVHGFKCCANRGSNRETFFDFGRKTSPEPLGRRPRHFCSQIFLYINICTQHSATQDRQSRAGRGYKVRPRLNPSASRAAGGGKPR
jgi:hypothetical protein